MAETETRAQRTTTTRARITRVGGVLRSGIRGIAGLLATVVRIIAVVIAVILVVHIVLVLGNANPDNSITKGIADLARPLALGFKDLFSPSSPKLLVLVNFGLAALFWLVVGALVSRIIRRIAG